MTWYIYLHIIANFRVRKYITKCISDFIGYYMFGVIELETLWQGYGVFGCLQRRGFQHGDIAECDWHIEMWRWFDSEFNLNIIIITGIPIKNIDMAQVHRIKLYNPIIYVRLDIRNMYGNNSLKCEIK